jgi:hypothetical protein
VLAHLHEFAEHYNHHHEAHEKPDLLDFIADHYIAENHHDDHADEEDLPLDHDHSSTEYQNQVVFACFEHKDEKTTPEAYREEINNFFCNPPFSFDFVSNIWQPPKMI